MTLRRLYWLARIPEYWLVDARKNPPEFNILRYTSKGYVNTRKRNGWVRSAVFGKEFRLTTETGPLGHPIYTLHVR